MGIVADIWTISAKAVEAVSRGLLKGKHLHDITDDIQARGPERAELEEPEEYPQPPAGKSFAIKIGDQYMIATGGELQWFDDLGRYCVAFDVKGKRQPGWPYRDADGYGWLVSVSMSPVNEHEDRITVGSNDITVRVDLIPFSVAGEKAESSQKVSEDTWDLSAGGWFWLDHVTVAVDIMQDGSKGIVGFCTHTGGWYDWRFFKAVASAPLYMLEVGASGEHTDITGTLQERPEQLFEEHEPTGINGNNAPYEVTIEMTNTDPSFSFTVQETTGAWGGGSWDESHEFAVWAVYDSSGGISLLRFGITYQATMSGGYAAMSDDFVSFKHRDQPYSQQKSLNLSWNLSGQVYVKKDDSYLVEIPIEVVRHLDMDVELRANCLRQAFLKAPIYETTTTTINGNTATEHNDSIFRQPPEGHWFEEVGDEVTVRITDNRFEGPQVLGYFLDGVYAIAWNQGVSVITSPTGCLHVGIALPITEMGAPTPLDIGNFVAPLAGEYIKSDLVEVHPDTYNSTAPIYCPEQVVDGLRIPGLEGAWRREEAQWNLRPPQSPYDGILRPPREYAEKDLAYVGRVSKSELPGED